MTNTFTLHSVEDAVYQLADQLHRTAEKIEDNVDYDWNDSLGDSIIINLRYFPHHFSILAVPADNEIQINYLDTRTEMEEKRTTVHTVDDLMTHLKTTIGIE